MDCGHEQMSIQDFNKKINGFKSTYSIAYFLINCLSLIKYKSWNYCFCIDYGNEKKSELCVIGDDFGNFENVVCEKILDSDFLLNYHIKFYPYLWRLFFAKKTASCCFLDVKFILLLTNWMVKILIELFVWKKLLMHYFKIN